MDDFKIRKPSIFFAVVVDKLKSVLFVHDVERAGVVEVGGYGDYRAVALGVPIKVGVGGFGFVVFVFSRQDIERFPLPDLCSGHILQSIGRGMRVRVGSLSRHLLWGSSR